MAASEVGYAGWWCRSAGHGGNATEKSDNWIMTWSYPGHKLASQQLFTVTQSGPKQAQATADNGK